MITYQYERFRDFYAEAGGLMAEHDREVSTWGKPYALDLPHYRALEANGQLYVLTARADGEMIGYLMFKVARHPHYQILVAWEDAHFLTKRWRRGLLNPWFKMVRLATKTAREVGAQAFVMHSKSVKPIGKLFGWLGFTQSDSLWTMRF